MELRNHTTGDSPYNPQLLSATNLAERLRDRVRELEGNSTP